MADIVLGPILYARPSTVEEWRFEVHVTVAGNDDAPPSEGPDFEVRNPSNVGVTVSTPQFVHEFEGHQVRIWGWSVSVARDAVDHPIYYQLNGKQYGPVAIPRRSTLPRFAFFSCNGFSDPADVHKVQNPVLMWEDLMERHEIGLGTDSVDDLTGIHLLVGGGDQIYCDALWQKPTLLRLSGHAAAQVSPDDRQHILGDYIAWYQKQWGHQAMATAMSCIPAVMTWDDHDIFDGWGSHAEALQSTDLHQAVFEAAKETFSVFQLGGQTNPLVTRGESHFLQMLHLESEYQTATMILPDLRGNRTRTQVLSEQQWADLTTTLSDFRASEDPRESYLLLISGIPVVYRRTRAEWISAGGLEDDRRDQWEHGSRRNERTRLIHHLLDAIGPRDRAAVISGDVHVASRGRIVSSLPGHRRDGVDSVIHQVTSSAIVHPEPKFLEWLGFTAASTDSPSVVGSGITTELLEISPEEKYVRARNYVLGAFTAPVAAAPSGPTHQASTGALWLQWIRETSEHGKAVAESIPEQLVVHGRARS